MSCTAEELFKTYFAELERRDIPYVVLHSYEQFPAHISSDVDYSVRPEDLPRIYPVIAEVAQRSGWWIVQTLRYEMDAYYSVLMNEEHPEKFLKLDRTSHFTDNGCLFIPVDWMLEGRRKYNGFFVPQQSSEFIYALAKAFSKKKNIADMLPRLRQLWSTEPERSQQLFEKLLGRDAGDLRKWFERPAEEWLQLSDVMHERNRYNLTQKFREWVRRAQRFFEPSGVRLAFLGPDGVGKSATIAGVQTRLQPCFRRQEMIHFRPMIFQKSDGKPVSNPHGRPPRSVPASWAKVLWYFCDHWLGWIFKQRAALSRSTGIIFDRNFDDLVIDSKRYRLKGSQWLVKLLRPLVPQPEITFILDAPAAVIHKRKPELEVAEIEAQRTALRKLAEGDSRYVIVSTESTPDEVADEVCRHVIRFMAKREQRRFGQ